MASVFHILPLLQVKDRSRQNKNRKAGPVAKYDHWAMVQDRLSGMNWRSIAEKHNVKGDKHGEVALRLCMNSNAIKKLTPKDVEMLGAVGWRRRCK